MSAKASVVCICGKEVAQRSDGPGRRRKWCSEKCRHRDFREGRPGVGVAYARAYYAAHREEVLARARANYSAREDVREKKRERESRQVNREGIERARRRSRYRANRELFKAKARDYRRTRPEKVRAAWQRYYEAHRAELNAAARAWQSTHRAFRRTLYVFLNLEKTLETINRAVADQTTGAMTLEEMRAEERTKTTGQLLREFRAGMATLGADLLRLAVKLVELESRGEDVGSRSDGRDDRYFLSFLRKLGTGELLIGVVTRWALDRGHVFDAVKNKPVQEQERFLAMTDAEVEEALKRPPRGPSQRSAIRLAEATPPEDLAELCLKMVRANSNPSVTARLLVAKLRKLAKTQPAEPAVTA